MFLGIFHIRRIEFLLKIFSFIFWQWVDFCIKLWYNTKIKGNLQEERLIII